MDCFLPLKMVCFLLMEKIELRSNEDAAIAEVFVLGEGWYSMLVHFAFLFRILVLLWLFVSYFQ